jgi:glycosyltransferase involved in cell wall biosynthesis
VSRLVGSTQACPFVDDFLMPLHQTLNILQSCFSQSWGGLEIQALEVTRKLQERGHRVWLACCQGSRLAQEAHPYDINIVPLNVTGYVHPQIAWGLGRFIKRHGIKIIHCQLSKDLATVVPAMKMSGRTVPIILSKRVGSYVRKKDLFHRFTHAHVSRVLAISEAIHKNVLDTTPMTPDRVVTLHDAIDTDLFSLRRVDRYQVRREFGFPDDATIIGFVGRFTPGKGHEEFLEAAKSIVQKHTNTHFLVVGEASHGEQRYEQKIRTLAISLGLERAVTFAGFRRDIPEVMAAFDIFVFPSHAESFGVALIEAMAMERPVVSTNCDGVLDIVVDGVTGLYVHPRNAEELAAAIARLIDNPLLREKMGKAGRGRVEDLFDQRKQMNRIEELYYQLLDKESV